VVRADTDDPGSLPVAFAGLAGLFVMTVFAVHGPEGEVAQGKAVVDAALAAGVPHVVYSSVGGANRGSGVPHFESKWEIEQHFRERGLPTTVVRPVFFMENFISAMAPSERAGILSLRAPLLPEVPLQLISVRDIGAIAAAVLTDPGLVPSGAVEIAGVELTPEQVAAAFGRRTGATGRFEPVPIETVSDDDSRAMFTWLSRTPSYQADFALTKKLQPEVLTFDAFLAATSPHEAGRGEGKS
jgi:uncharacterized protein YbjT (DUF2867 family)